MLIDQITNAGALPTLEAVMRFAGQRQRMLAHNIANLSTPDFRPMEAGVEGFQASLREAVEQRRKKAGGAFGDLTWAKNSGVEFGPGGAMRLKARTPSGGVLFQDRNNRDLERLMQDVAENSAAFRVASDLYRQQAAVVKAAMAERVV